MSYSVWLLVHLLGVIVWVGGMFFMQMALRPAAAQVLQPPQRLPLLAAVLERFFFWVSIAIGLILVSGAAILWIFASGGGRSAWYMHAMIAIGLVMMAIFGHIRFAGYARLTRAVRAEDWPAGGAAMAQIRLLVLVNLLLGLAATAIVVLGRGWT